jgi:hypothetical protein
MHSQNTPARLRTDPAPWPFAPLTEAQTAARLCQEAAMRREAARTHHSRLGRARVALASMAVVLAACGGGGDDPEAVEAANHIGTPAVKCPVGNPAPCI